MNPFFFLILLKVTKIRKETKVSHIPHILSIDTKATFFPKLILGYWDDFQEMTTTPPPPHPENLLLRVLTL